MGARIRRIWRRTGRFLVALVLIPTLLIACSVQAVLQWVTVVPGPWILLTAELTGRAASLLLVEVLAIAAVMLLGPLLWEIFRGKDEYPQDLTVTYDAECACQADRSYGNPGQGGMRYAERFWFEGGVFGFVEEPRSGPIYVVFRGTSEVGNWFLTNAQAHMVKADKVFPTKLLGREVPGGVHQGFVKAFEDLWLDKQSGDPPPCGAPASARSRRGFGEADEDYPSFVEGYKWSKWLWPVIYAVMLSPVAWWADFWPDRRPAALEGMTYQALWPVMAGLLIVGLWFIQLLFAYGQFEFSFRRSRTLAVGPALLTLVEKTSRLDAGGRARRVVFTGHSLGGALATFAFVYFCQQSSNDGRPAELVTFGAPRPGEAHFLEWLERLVATRPDTRMALFAHYGDPVPYLPPSPGFVSRVSRRATWLSALLSAFYVAGWLPYAFAYKANFKTQWASLLKQGGEEGLNIAAHSAYHPPGCTSDIHRAGRAVELGQLQEDGGASRISNQ